MFDFLIVGAGFAHSVLSERIASQLGKTCLIVEKRNHIGSNADDHYDSAGVLLHTYGPHYFRTNSQRIIDYLSNSWSGAKSSIRSSPGRMVATGAEFDRLRATQMLIQGVPVLSAKV
jgi:choline dehydrogenase-like flavoprotein